MRLAPVILVVVALGAVGLAGFLIMDRAEEPAFAPGDGVVVIAKTEARRDGRVVVTLPPGHWGTALQADAERVQLPSGWVLATAVRRPEEAIALMTRRIDDDANDVDALLGRAGALTLEEDYAQALEDFARAEQLGADVHGPRGLTFFYLGAYERALVDLSAAIEQQPSVADLVARGSVWSAKGEPEQALADFEQAVQTNSDLPGGYNERAWLRATHPDEALRDGPKAVEDAEHACKLTGWRDPNCLDTLAAAHAEAGNFDAAVRWQEKALEFDGGKHRDRYESRIEMYKRGEPYRQPARN